LVGKSTEKDSTSDEGTKKSSSPTQPGSSTIPNLESLFSGEDAIQYERKDIFFGNVEELDIWYEDSDDELNEDENQVTQDGNLLGAPKKEKEDGDESEEEMDVTKINLLKFCQLNNPSLQGDSFSRTAFQDQFKPLFNSPHLSDVTFLAQDASTQEWKKIYAHKLILKTRAKFFRTMFRSGMREAKQEEVRIQSVPHDILLCLLEYLYTGVLKIAYEKALLILAAANQFQMDDVKQIVAQYFAEIIDAEIACLLYEESFFHNAAELRELCLSYIEENPERVLNSTAFQNMTIEMVLEIIKSDYLVVEEYTLFMSCVAWAKAQAKGDSSDGTSDQEWPTYFAKIVEYIRFPRMKPLELRDHIEKEYKDVVPRLYILEAYKYHALPKSVKSIRAHERYNRSSYKWSTTNKSANIILSNGDLTAKMNSQGSRTVCADVLWSSGVHYFEVTIDSSDAKSNIMVGVADPGYVGMDMFMSHNSRGWAISSPSGERHHNSMSNAYGSAFGKGTVVGVLVDLSTREIRFFVNGTDLGVAFSNLNGSVSPCISLYGKNDQVTLNSQARPPLMG